MLYYPGFEVKDINWLKFALLYLDDLRPIIPMIPYSKDQYLSPMTLKIMEETDLIKAYCPEYTEGNIASLFAMQEFDNYLRKPKLYASQFNYNYRSANFLPEKWHSESQQNYILYEGKFSTDFYHYCLDAKIAHRCDEGIKINEDLAFVYMSFLADVISKANEMEAITDLSKYNNLVLKNDSMLSRSAGKELKYARSNIELNIPIGLNAIPIEKFISLRASNQFNHLRIAFTNEIKNLILAKETHNEGYSLESLLEYKKEFIKFSQQSLNMISSITLTSYGLYQIANDNLTPFTLLSATAGIYQNISTVIHREELKDIFTKTQDKHLARKYIANLKRLT